MAGVQAAKHWAAAVKYEATASKQAAYTLAEKQLHRRLDQIQEHTISVFEHVQNGFKQTKQQLHARWVAAAKQVKQARVARDQEVQEQSEEGVQEARAQYLRELKQSSEEKVEQIRSRPSAEQLLAPSS